jgi:hypothetical protein
MSLLGDLVNSIATGKPTPPPPAPSGPVISNGQRTAPNASSSALKSGASAASPAVNGLKRKAEDGTSKQPEKIARPNGTSATIDKPLARTAAPPLHGPKPAGDKTLPPRPKLSATTGGLAPKFGSAPATPTNASAKAPAKGSFAELMARAKAAQTGNGPNQVGVLKHQSVQKEKVSKMAERKRQEEEKTKSVKEKPSARSTDTKGRPQIKSRSASPAKRTDQGKVAKTPRPPLHAPATSTYKGTMGKQSDRKQPPKNRRRYDEYLGTDEEEDSDMADEGEDVDDYGSDASSDMEAGAFDLEEEDQRALKHAKEEDARELALENQLKREKEEKRKKLMALAAKRR